MGGIVEKVVDPIVKVFSKAISWLIPTPDIPDFGLNEPEDFETGVLLNKQSNDANIPVVYGERLLGGTRVFIETSGTDNTYLYVALVLSEGEIDSIQQIKIDDKVVTFASSFSDGTAVEVDSSDSNFYKGESLIRLEPHYGSDGQSASTLLSTLSSWGSNHKLSGLAYVAVRFKWNQDVFGSIPKIQALVRGKKVVAYNSSLVAQTASYSTNPAWCLLNYLTDARYGKGLAITDIDLQSFYDASQVCVTQVTPYSGGSDINIFDANAVLDTSKKIIENTRTLLKGCRGYLPYTSGKYKLVIETIGSASITLNEDDIFGGYSLASPNQNDKYNRVIVSYVSPTKNWQVDEVQFPPIDDSGLPSADQHATMKTADSGFLLEGRYDFGQVITSTYQAEEMAEIILRRSREAIKLNINAGGQAYDLAIGDIVNITHSSLGFSAKPFRVNSLSFNEDFTVGLNLIEHQNSHYTWATKTQAPTVPSTTLPNPFVVQPPASVTLTDQLIAYNDGTVIVALDVAIGASPDSFVDYYQVEYKLSTESDYKIHSQGSGLFQRVLNVIDQKVYDVRVKAVSSFGTASTYVSAQRTIVGSILPPSDVTDFSCNIINGEAHLSWEQISDLDLAYYQIRYSTLTSGATWQNSVSLVEKVSRPATSIVVPARVGSYCIKAVDKLGNFSLNETIIATNVTSIGNFNNITTQSENPNFTGTKTNLTLDSNLLRLTDLGSNGTYDFASVIDIGAVHTSRITATLAQFAENPSELFDAQSGDFDDKTGSFDGDSPSNSNAHLEIAVSNDNSTFTEFKNFVIGDYTARYLKFRLVLISRDGVTTPVISQATVTVDMEDRIQSGNDIASGATTKTVAFTNPYKTANYAVGITGQGMATGDYFLVESKTINGFNVTFKNASNTVISRTFDFIAKGF
ncbi:phage tail protein [uncultured Mediterranean phage uvMED]|nr:phage tail protein [uncultured Mediterranean phage uvMED]